VATLLWNRKTDEITLGQWFKGTIYELRSDLSPNGKYMIYFAAKRAIGVNPETWTAISITPYLKALALYPNGLTYCGGGLFIGEDTYWLQHRIKIEVTTLCDTNLVHRDHGFKATDEYGGGDLGVYFPRLLRDGWKILDTKGNSRPEFYEFERAAGKYWKLRKRIHASSDSLRGKGFYWAEHELIKGGEHGQTVVSFPDWEWADMDRNRLVWCENGQLKTGTLLDDGLYDSVVIYDFNDMRFQAIKAPY
jgi:hypothetical protein